ncbi:MAG: hypothetical protein AAF202_04095 [Pseudomonadota bacterium]
MKTLMIYSLLLVSFFAQLAAAETAAEAAERRLVNSHQYYNQSLESLGEYPMDNQVQALEEMEVLLKSYFEENPEMDPEHVMQWHMMRLYSTLGKLVIEAKQKVSAVIQAGKDGSLSPLAARQQSFQDMIHLKGQALDAFDRLFQDVNIDDVATVFRGNEYIRLFQILESLGDTRFKMSVDETEIYRSLVLTPWAQRMVRLIAIVEEPKFRLHYMNNIASKFRDPLQNDALLGEMLRSENFWVVMPQRGLDHRIYDGFSYMMYNRSLLPSLRDEERLFSGFVPEAVGEGEAEFYYQEMASFMPESATEYLLGSYVEGDVANSIEKFIVHLKKISNDYKALEAAHREPKLGTGVDDNFARHVYFELQNFYYQMGKGMHQLVSLIHAYFAGFIPDETQMEEGTGPFDPRSVRVSDHINLRSFVMSLSSSLTDYRPYPFTQMHEKIFFELLYLSKDFDDIGAGTQHHLRSVFRRYRDLKLPSQWIQGLADLVIAENTFEPSTKLTAIDYLVQVDPEKAYLLQTREVIVARGSSYPISFSDSQWGEPADLVDSEGEHVGRLHLIDYETLEVFGASCAAEMNRD